jgi:hypothetical protein
MKQAEFATLLFPVNYAYCEQKGGSVSALQKARENNMGVIAIKALAQRRWQDDEERLYPKCWYRPIYDAPALAKMALNYTLSRHVDTLLPPGDPRMLRLALDIIGKQGGRAALLSEEDNRAIQQAAAESPDIIF